MGAFNVLKIKKCYNCQSNTEVSIQFKYGDVWQYEYKIGDALKWGGNDTGVQGAKKVVIDGAASRCNVCGKELDYVINLELNQIKSTELNVDQYRFCKETYIIIEQ